MNKIYTVKLTLADCPGKKDIYLARVESSPRGASAGAAIEFQLPPIPRGMPDYPSYFASFENNKDKSEIIGELEMLGTQLYNQVFSRNVSKKMEQVVGMVAADPDRKLRIAVNLLSPELVSVPWEFLFADNNFLANKKQYSIVRIVDELILPSKSIGPVSHPMVIIANPGGQFKSAEHIETLKKLFKAGNISEENIAVLEKATDKNFFPFLDAHRETDFLYFLGHGETDSKGNGLLLLETEEPGTVFKKIQARTIASAIRGLPKLHSVYLNSCLSGTGNSGTLAGVAQKILLDGDVVSVIAMQAEIGVEEAKTLATTFIQGVTRMDTVEDAIQNAKARFTEDDFTWGIPVIYTHIEDAGEYEKNQLLSLFSSAKKGELYTLCIPSFKNTLLEEELREKKYDVEVYVNKAPIGHIYHYPGLSFAQSDVKAVGFIQSLLRNITDEEKITVIKGAEIETATTGKCTFLFGSRSNVYVSQVLNGFQKEFEMKYGDDEWSITDTVYNKIYSLKPPYLSGHSDFSKIQDFAFIQKIVDGDKIFFLLCGLGDRGTIGASWWLKEHWKEVLKQFGTNAFSIVLRFPTSNYQHCAQVDRKKGLEGGNDSDLKI